MTTETFNNTNQWSKKGGKSIPPYWDHSQMPKMDIFPSLQQDSPKELNEETFFWLEILFFFLFGTVFS